MEQPLANTSLYKTLFDDTCMTHLIVHAPEFILADYSRLMDWISKHHIVYFIVVLHIGYL